ncbi:hypothetical protein QP185_17610 [Sphingomonas aerolata]|uniref:hypothetical protein n=1 Tax=Sphingomonas aerolata TaxID=185951 RepID=UPI002FE2B2C3
MSRFGGIDVVFANAGMLKDAGCADMSAGRLEPRHRRQPDGPVPRVARSGTPVPRAGVIAALAGRSARSCS